MTKENVMTTGLKTLATAAGFTLAATLPAAAQDELCAGIGTNGQWIGGTEEMSDVATADAAMEQMALVLLGNEYVSLFSVSETSEVRLESEGRGNGDPVITLYDTTGATLLTDDDSGGGSASRAETTLEPGTYCLGVSSFNNSPMTSFVRVGLTEHEPLTPGIGGDTGDDALPVEDDFTGDGFNDDDYYNSSAEPCFADTFATEMASGPVDSMLTGTGLSVTGSATEQPYVRFTLEAPAAVSITAENVAADPIIAVYDLMGGFLAENDDYDGLNSRIDFTTPLEAGDYCINVRAYSDETQPITVTLSAFDANAALISSYDRGEASPPLDGSHPVTDLGVLENRQRRDNQTNDKSDWFSFTVDEASLVLIEAIAGGNGDPYLVLYDDFGRLIDQNDDYGTGLDSLITARVQRGTYLIGVRQLGTGTQGLVRLLLERYIPAP